MKRKCPFARLPFNVTYHIPQPKPLIAYISKKVVLRRKRYVIDALRQQSQN